MLLHKSLFLLCDVVLNGLSMKIPWSHYLHSSEGINVIRFT